MLGSVISMDTPQNARVILLQISLCFTSLVLVPRIIHIGCVGM
jgi:hypothetical protein